MKTLIAMVLFLAPQLASACTATLSSTLFNLAADARLHARLPESEVLYNRAIALREAACGPDSPELARPLAGLALLQLAEGQLSQALDTAGHAVRVSASQPADVRLTAEAQNALATVFMVRGDNARAETIEQTVAGNLRNAPATRSQEYVDALANLGTAHLRMANYRQAELDLRAAEAAALPVFGLHDPSTAIIWNNLAKTRAAQGDWKDAEELFQKAIAAWRASLGQSHPDVASGLANLAALYQSRKRYSEAAGLYRQAIEIDQAALGPDSLKLANDWDNLGALFAVQHRYRDAETAIAKGLAIAEKKAGFAHPDTAGIAVNLAVVYCSEAKYAAASNLFAKALPVKKQLLAPDSAELAGLQRLYSAAEQKIALRAATTATPSGL